MWLLSLSKDHPDRVELENSDSVGLALLPPIPWVMTYLATAKIVTLFFTFYQSERLTLLEYLDLVLF